MATATISPEQAALNQAREDCLALADKLADLRRKAPESRSENWKAELAETFDVLNAADREYTVRQNALGARVEQSRGPQAATRDISTLTMPRSLGQCFIENEEIKELREKGRLRGFRGEIEVPLSACHVSRRTIHYAEAMAADMERRDVIGSAVDDGVNAGLFIPVLTPQLNARAIDRRRLFIEDLLASGTISTNNWPYIQELNPRSTETGVSSVSEGQDKPEIDLAMQRQDAPVRKIAGWKSFVDEVLDDAPGLRTYVDGRLMYMADLAAEDQILNGNGAAPDLRGILNTSGVQSQGLITNGTADPASTIAMAIAKIELVDGYPDGIAMNPTDFWTMETRRTTSSGEYDDMINGVVIDRVWGLRVVRTRALAAGLALVGDYAQGAMVLHRQEAAIRVSDQHASNFIKNLLTILVERRLALAVDRPDWFVKTTVA